jgi:ATP/maltotriose-dependent transcriptional regulator MalT
MLHALVMTTADEAVASYAGHGALDGLDLRDLWSTTGAAPIYSPGRVARVRRSIAGARAALLAMRLDEDASTTSQLRRILRDRAHPTLGGYEAAVRMLQACVLAAADDFLAARCIDRTLLALLEGLYRALPRNDAQLADLRPRIAHLLSSTVLGASEEPASTSHQSLSRRETGVLRMIAHGMSNKRIAKSLGITPETVKSHAKNIFVKLAARTRAQAVARAEATGLLKPALALPLNAARQIGSGVIGYPSTGRCS